MSFRDLKLKFKLILFSSITVFLLGIVFIIAFPLIQYKQSISMVKDRVNVIDIMLGKNLASPLEFFDNVSTDLVLKALDGIENLNFISVFDFNKNVFSTLNDANFKRFDSTHVDFMKTLLSQASHDSIRHEATYLELEDFYIFFNEIRNDDDKLTGYLLISFDISNITEATSTSRLIAILVTLLFIAISAFISYSFSYLIVKPIEKIMDFFRSMADGKGDLTKRIDIRSKDEIGILASEFNRFIEAQSGMIFDIKNASDTINERIQVIEELSNENNNLINDLIASLDQIHSTVTQLEFGADLNVGSAKNATAQSEKSIMLSTESQKAVESSINQMNSIKSQVEKLESDMTSLHERSQQIQNISDLLKDISDRTTILALNTSIEANKAGEHGSGFLIIADEIHQLADQSIHSLEDINRLTLDLQRNLDQSYKVTLNTSKEVESGMENIEETGGQIKDSLSSVKNNLTHINEVFDMANEQKARINEIVETISTSVSNITHIKQSVDNTLGSVQEQKKHINNLTQLMDNFKVKE